MVGNKTNIDSEVRRLVSTEDAEHYAADHNMLYIETCPKTNEGVKDAFYVLAMELHLRDAARARRKRVSKYA